MERQRRPYAVQQAIINGDRELLSRLGKEGARKGARKGGLVSGQRQREAAAWRQILRDTVMADMEQQQLDAVSERVKLMGLSEMNASPDLDDPDGDYDLIPYED